MNKINTKLKTHTTLLLAVVGIVVVSIATITLNTFSFTNAYAVTTEQAASCGSNISLTYSEACDEKKKAEACQNSTDPNCTASGSIETLIKTIINVISAIVGAVAVIMIIIGGFRFVTAGGDSNNVSSAKNTIVYAIVGLVIVAFAQVIVRFVLQRI